MKRIFVIIGLLIFILNNYSQEGKFNYLDVTEEFTVRDTSIIDLIETHGSSSAVGGANGLSKSGDNIELGGSAFNKDVVILGAGYNIDIGTFLNKVGDFNVDASNDVNIKFSGLLNFVRNGGGEVYFDGTYFISSGGDTLANYDDVRTLIEENSQKVPFNFDYRFSTSITDSRPGVGYFRLNNATYSNVTKIFIDAFDANSVSKSNFLSIPDTGSYITITDGINYINYQLTGALTTASSYYKYDVTYLGNSGVISGLVTISMDLSNSVGGNGGIDSVLASQSDTLILKLDTLLANGIIIKSQTNVSDTVKTPIITDNGSGDVEINASSSIISTATNENVMLTQNGMNYAGINAFSNATNNELQIELYNGTYNSNFTFKDSLIFYAFLPDTLLRINKNETKIFTDFTIKTGTNQYEFIEDTLFAEEENIKAKTLSAVDSIQHPDGSWTTGSIDAQTAIESIEFEKLQLDTSNQNYSNGTAFYNKNNKTFTFYDDINGAPNYLSRNIYVPYFNNSGSLIPGGKVLRSTGDTTINNEILFTAGLGGNGSLDSLNGVAFSAHDCAINTRCKALVIGEYLGLDLTSIADNAAIYVGSNGNVIDTAPHPPAYTKMIGKTIKGNDNDTTSLFFTSFEEIKYLPLPVFSASFNDSLITISNPGINTYALITNATNNLFIEKLNYGFQLQGDTVRALQSGVYKVNLSKSFYGDATVNDVWNIGVFKNGVLQFKTQRTSSSTSRGGVPFTVPITLTSSDWVSFKVENTTSGTRASVFVDAVINFEFVTDL